MEEAMTYYDTLGVAPTASMSDIKAAYRRLALKFHPDKSPNVNEDVRRLIEEKFKDVQEAHDILKDSAERAQYDAQLGFEVAQAQQTTAPPPTPPSYEAPSYHAPSQNSASASQPHPKQLGLLGLLVALGLGLLELYFIQEGSALAIVFGIVLLAWWFRKRVGYLLGSVIRSIRNEL